MADEAITWYDPDGTATVLDVEWGIAGRWMPPIEVTREALPGAGSIRRHTRHAMRPVALPLWVQGTDEADLYTHLRDLVWAMDPTRGDGRLRVATSGGVTRELLCRLSEGLQLSEAFAEQAGPTWQRATALIEADHPYWLATTDEADSWAYDGSDAVSLLPVPDEATGDFVLLGAGAATIAAPTVTNPGDVDAWPVWVLTGPGDEWVVSNDTTGRTLDLLTTLAAGETIRIDTRPRALSTTPKTVTDEAATNLYGALAAGSWLWPLAKGANNLRIQVDGASSGVTTVALTYTPRYLTP